MTSDYDEPTNGDSQHENHARKSKKKRKHRDERDSNLGDMISAPELLPQVELPEFSLIAETPQSSNMAGSPRDHAYDNAQEWQTVENGRPTKKAKKLPKPNTDNYPTIKFSSASRLQSQIKISDLQNLVLYILADAAAPQFVSVRHRNQIRKVVVLMVPGLEKSMFIMKSTDDGDGRQKEDADSRREKRLEEKDRGYSYPDDYYPTRLSSETLPEEVKPFSVMFEDLWPVKTPGDDKYGRMHSPFHAMLTAPMPKTKEEKKWQKTGKGASQAKEPIGWQNVRTRVTEFIHSPDELLENDYTLHHASYDDEKEKTALANHRRSTNVSQVDGWVDTLVKTFDEGSVPENEIENGSLTAGRELLAMDCEMCKTGETEFSLTRISIVGWDGAVILDELVKPDKPIIDYLTMYSGITEKMLASVTTTLADIQKELLRILHPRSILVGHSLNSDLTALKLTHPFVIDTALIFPHPRGPPLKSSLKWLAQRYLNREIQKGHGTTGPGAGHDSIEDARTCLDLVKQKCEKGRHWGTSDAQGENLFKRVARTGVTYKSQGGSAVPSALNGKSSAAVDWGDPKKGAGAAATFAIGCNSDEEVMEGIIRAVRGDPDGKEIPGGGVDFTFGRLRELEALKGWWNNNKLIAAEQAAKDERSGPLTETDDIVMSDVPIDDDTEAVATTFPDPAPPPVNDQGDAPTAVHHTTSLPPPTLSSLDPKTSISTATSLLTRRLEQIYDALPLCTAFIVYSGSGDPREMSRLQAMQAQFKREYKIKKWDQLSVKWTDVEEQALKRAVRQARDGIAFIGVK